VVCLTLGQRCAKLFYYPVLSSGRLNLKSPHPDLVLSAEITRKLLNYLYTGDVFQFKAAEADVVLGLFEYFGFSEQPQFHNSLATRLEQLITPEPPE